MPKLKTRKSVSSRFKKTSSGKVKNKRGKQSHLRSKKSGKKVRKLRKDKDTPRQLQKVVEKMAPFS